MTQIKPLPEYPSKRVWNDPGSKEDAPNLCGKIMSNKDIPNIPKDSAGEDTEAYKFDILGQSFHHI